MPANESLTHSEGIPEQRQEETVSRRRLLKAILATGGAVAASALLPGTWRKPVVEVGVLPAHAQITRPTEEPLGYIDTCHAADNQGAPVVGPDSILETYADIEGPVVGGIAMRRTITLPGNPDNVVTGTTNGTGRFQPADFDLSPYGLADGDVVTVLWEFVNPDDGTGSCQNNITIFAPT